MRSAYRDDTPLVFDDLVENGRADVFRQSASVNPR